jgi:isoleucyl-tRNA synthetase
VLHWLAETDGFVRDHVKNFEFGRLAHRLHNFCANELSAFYFDIRKDRLYCDRPDSFERRSCRTVLAHVFEYLVSWLAPMLCYTAEEAWSYRPQGISKIDSVHMTTFPEPYDSWKDNDLAERWNKIRDMRRVVLGALEPKRMDKTIGSSLEAAPVVYVSSEYKAALNMNSLAEIAITSQVTLETGEGPANAFRLDDVPGVAVVFAKAEGNRCARCWKVLPEVGTDKEYPDLSPRDADAVRWYLQNRKAA